jgi:hypothetical protein
VRILMHWFLGYEMPPERWWQMLGLVAYCQGSQARDELILRNCGCTNDTSPEGPCIRQPSLEPLPMSTERHST